MTGNDVAVLRVKARLKQWEVAAALGYSGAWLSYLERDKTPLEPGLVKRIAETIDKLAAQTTTR
jgi:hypothetical protein